MAACIGTAILCGLTVVIVLPGVISAFSQLAVLFSSSDSAFNFLSQYRRVLSGILKINKCYAEYSVKPKIEVADTAFKITFPNTNYHRSGEAYCATKEPHIFSRSQQSEREEAILRLLRQNGSIVRQEVQELLGVSQATAILILRRMIENKTLVKERNGPYLRYRVGRKADIHI